MSRHVLIVEDEAPIREGLEELLRGQGYEPTLAEDGQKARAALEAHSFALVMLDLMIPPPTGLELLRSMRAAGDTTPVLILTALGAESDIVAGLEAGADDYVTKPFGIRELVARANALARRSAATPKPARFELGALLFDLPALEVKEAGRSVRLTSREAALLEHLIAHRERAVSREELLVEVWGYRDGTVRTRTVDVHVQQLRAKLAKLPRAAAVIVTIRGSGYRFDDGTGS